MEREVELADLRVELERSERRVEAMKQIGRALGSNLELDPLLAELVARTTELLEADRSTLFLADRERRELSSKVLEGQELHEIRLAFGVGIAGWVAEHERPQNVERVYDDPRFNPDFDRASGYHTRCMLVWPVRHPHRQELLGVVQVLNKKVGVFDATDERLLEAIASEIGVALQVAHLYREAVERSEALERARGELSLLLETERALAATRELETMLQIVLESAMIAMRAASGSIHVLDERGARLEVLAARNAGVRSTSRRELEESGSVVGEALRSGCPVVEQRSPEDDEPAEWASKAAIPIDDEELGLIGVLSLQLEVGREPLAEHDIATLAAVAAQAGRAIGNARRRKEREQSERLAAIGRMLSGLIHDLRTPMTLISGYSEVMVDSEDRDERARHARKVQKQVDLLASMTKDLLAFARGERSLLVRKVYVARFMEEMKEYLERDLEGSGVRLELEVRFRGTARFDETKVRRVFHNITRNAREAMPGGGRLGITVEVEGRDLVFHFDDEGRGIPEEVRDRLFEPFATAGKAGGTGLGLAMVKQIADEHRGTVTFGSAPGRGTRFTFRIPLEA